jgi:CelD/BcsL family acetyltransferase involved in cellulose biosynthesis
MLKIEVIETYEAFLLLKPIWNELVSKCPIEHPFLSFEWLSCLWKAYGQGTQLFILIVKYDSDIIGIAPLMKIKTKFRGIPAKAITFIANRETNRAEFILLDRKKEVVDFILKFLINEYRKFDLLDLDVIQEGTETDKFLLECLKEKKCNYLRNRVISSPFITINGSWDDYIRSKSKNFRNELKSINKHFENTGNYEILKYTTQDIDKALNELLIISKNSWKHKYGMDLASTKENISFYSDFADAVSKSGLLNIWILKLNSKPIAFYFDLFFKNKLFALRTSYDEKYLSSSPGKFLNNYVMKESFDKGLIEYEWLGIDDKHKMRWSKTCHEHFRYCIFGDSLEGKILFFWEKYIISNIKKSNMTTVLVKKLLRRNNS